MAYGLSSNNYMMEKEKFHRTLNETRALLIRKCTDSRSFRRNFDLTLIGMDAEITDLTKYFNTYCSSQYASFDDYYIEHMVQKICTCTLNYNHWKHILIYYIEREYTDAWETATAITEANPRTGQDLSIQKEILESAKRESNDIILTLQRKYYTQSILEKLIHILANDGFQTGPDEDDGSFRPFHEVISRNILTPNERIESIDLWINELADKCAPIIFRLSEKFSSTYPLLWDT